MSNVLVLALALTTGMSVGPEPPLTLEVRIFHGTDEVTAETRVAVHRAGERTEPIAQAAQNRRLELSIPAGIYDLQAIRIRDGRVLSIRWAERLVVMPYPDEEGRHLEVINFTNGYGALQVRQRGAVGPPDAAIFAPADHDRPAAARAEGPDYALFIVLAGRYDVQTRHAGRTTWHRDIEVPLDRTRLWFVP